MASFIFTGGKMEFKTSESLAQDIKTRLGMLEGENPFNIDDGLPYIDLLQDMDKGVLVDTIISAVLEDERVAEVNDTLLDGVLTLKITPVDGEEVTIERTI